MGISCVRVWLGLAALLMLGALAATALPWLVLDWQPTKAWQQPWRWWTCVWVHYSWAHLAGNLLAAALVGAYGWAAQVPSRCTWAWLMSWPLMHLALLAQPELQHYGGLSGLMHAGVACVNVFLMAARAWGQRGVGALMHFMLCMKVLSEKPWVGAVQQSSDWDIAIAPVAHFSGLAMGTLCAAGFVFFRKTRRG